MRTLSVGHGFNLLVTLFLRGFQLVLFPLERLGPNFGPSLCDEASVAIQEQMFYAALRYNQKLHV